MPATILIMKLQIKFLFQSFFFYSQVKKAAVC